MKNKFSILALSLLVFLAAGCDWRGVRGNGTIKAEQRPVTDFTRIEAGGFYDIQWQPGPTSLSIETDENLLSNVETKVNGNVLKIEIHGQISPTRGIKIALTSPSLGGADLSGALKLKADGISGQRFTLETSGATKVTLAGRVHRLVASLTGASKLDADTLQTDEVEVAVTGAGKAEVNATKSLQAAITGAGRVTYGGNPKTVQKKVTGAGKISPRD
ncbi:head GIN domain-containing protein [soil metagenome]